jgi:hypothetical protein
MLEIGTQNGGSLELWKKFFHDNADIHGIDVDPKCTRLSFADGITFHLVKPNSIESLYEAISDLMFDIVLDDGSHISKDCIQYFNALWPRVKPGGLYVIEDLHASYWPEYGGSPRQVKPPSTIEYLKYIVDALHLDYVRQEKPPLMESWNRSVANISFFDSIACIEKYAHPKTKEFSCILFGEQRLVEANQNVRHVRDNLEPLQSAIELFAK